MPPAPRPRGPSAFPEGLVQTLDLGSEVSDAGCPISRAPFAREVGIFLPGNRLVRSKGLELDPASGNGPEQSEIPLAKSLAPRRISGFTKHDSVSGAIEGTRTPTPLPVHGPEPCASANSATMASGLTLQRRPEGRRMKDLRFHSTGAPIPVKLKAHRRNNWRALPLAILLRSVSPMAA